MITHADHAQENNIHEAAKETAERQTSGERSVSFIDHRSQALAQRKLHAMANRSPHVAQLRALQDVANSSRQSKHASQLQAMADNYPAKQFQRIRRTENTTGLSGAGQESGVEKQGGQVFQLGRTKSYSSKKGNTKKGIRKKFDFYAPKPLFDTTILHPTRNGWPQTRTLNTAKDFIRHFENERSREKFTSEELTHIDDVLDKAFAYETKKKLLLQKLLDLPRRIAPEALPESIVKEIGQPQRAAGGLEIRKRIKALFKARLEFALDTFFKAHPAIVDKIAWSLPKIANPFKNTPGLQNVKPAQNWDSTPRDYSKQNVKPLTGAAGKSSIRFKKLTKTSTPVPLKDQWTWEWKNILQDKNKPSQRLTLMHQIRGRFGGPSEQSNMFLGTAASNLTHDNSHVNQVEDRIAWAITSAPKWGIRDFYVDYQVEPQFGAIAPHVQQKINKALKGQDKIDAENWCKEATPQKYKTSWIMHVLSTDGQEGTYQEERTLNADE